MAAAVAVLLVAWAWQRSRSGDPPVVALARIRLPALLFALACTWIVVQIVPGLGASHEEWASAAALLGGRVRGSISVAPDRSIVGLTRLLTYAGAFWLALQAFRDPRAAERAMLVLALSAAAYALYGIGCWAAGSELVLWYQRWISEHGVVSSTFVNRNHFATFVGLGLLAALAVVAQRWVSTEQRLQRRSWDAVLRNAKLTSFLVAAAIPVDIMALLLTRSRAGTVAVLGGVLAFVLGFLWREGIRRAVAVVSVAVGAGVLALYLATAGSGLLVRLAGSEPTDGLRFAAYKLTLDAIRERPMTGYGYNAFRRCLQALAPAAAGTLFRSGPRYVPRERPGARGANGHRFDGGAGIAGCTMCCRPPAPPWRKIFRLGCGLRGSTGRFARDARLRCADPRRGALLRHRPGLWLRSVLAQCRRHERRACTTFRVRPLTPFWRGCGAGGRSARPADRIGHPEADAAFVSHR